MTTNGTELMHQCKTTQYCVVPYTDVSRKARAIRENSIRAEFAVVGNVHIRHQEILIRDRGGPATGYCATVDCAVFTDRIVVPYP